MYLKGSRLCCCLQSLFRSTSVLTLLHTQKQKQKQKQKEGGKLWNHTRARKEKKDGPTHMNKKAAKPHQLPLHFFRFRESGWKQKQKQKQKLQHSFLPYPCVTHWVWVSGHCCTEGGGVMNPQGCVCRKLLYGAILAGVQWFASCTVCQSLVLNLFDFCLSHTDIWETLYAGMEKFKNCFKNAQLKNNGFLLFCCLFKTRK